MTNGVYCLEGKWRTTLNGRASVRPVLEILEDQKQIKSRHSNVINGVQIGHYLDEWRKVAYNSYMTLFLAMHGTEGHVHWSSRDRDSLSLAQLANLMPNNVGGCFVYLGSCLTLADTRAGSGFVAETGVSALIGYEKQIDWIEGAAFETILLGLMANHNRHPKALFDLVMSRYPDLAKRLGFVVITNRSVERANKR